MFSAVYPERAGRDSSPSLRSGSEGQRGTRNAAVPERFTLAAHPFSQHSRAIEIQFYAEFRRRERVLTPIHRIASKATCCVSAWCDAAGQCPESEVRRGGCLRKGSKS
jgi:hypothetical protein